MKIEPTQNVTPQSSPPTAGADAAKEVDERFIWETLVPRLLHPSKLAIIQLLLSEDRALTPAELAKALQIGEELARYQCKSMESAGVLVVVDDPPGSEEDEEEPSYFFPKPPQAISSPSSSA